MRDIGANDHGRDLAPIGIEFVETSTRDASGSTQLGIHLHADVADVLILSLR